jgi:hypothetical protein
MKTVHIVNHLLPSFSSLAALLDLVSVFMSLANDSIYNILNHSKVISLFMLALQYWRRLPEAFFSPEKILKLETSYWIAFKVHFKHESCSREVLMHLMDLSLETLDQDFTRKM